jgi:N-glycosylase/DNA lyase
MLEWNAAEAALVAKQCDSRVASIVEAGGGRMLRGSTAFEDIVKTICTINTSWQNTQRMVRRLVGLSEVGAFPLPSEIMRLGEDRLRREASVGYRASTIIAVARIALECDLEAIELQRLREVRGLGPYAVDHIAVLRGDYSRIPIDSKVRTYCAKHLGIADPDVHSVNEYFSDWGKYRFLGYKFGRIARRLNWIGG